MNEQAYNELLEAASKRKLTSEEEARLQALFLESPDAQMAWEEEMALSDALRQMPEAPVASNFTARVMQAVEYEQAGQGRPAAWLHWLRLLVWSRKAVAGGALACLIAGVFYTQQIVARDEKAKNLATVSSVAQLPGVEVLKDFDMIQRLGQAPKMVDLELLEGLEQK